MVLLLLLAALLPEPVASSLHSSRVLAGGLGGSITHQCFYSPSPANQHQRKYWCKVAANGLCSTIISSSFTSSHYQGRVALEDVPQNGTFTVTMTGLRSSDSGTYRCGIGSTNRGLYASLNLTVLADATVSKPTQLIRGQLHGSVTVLCRSGDAQSAQKRFWCKVGRSSCTPIASSDGFVSRRYQGRIAITPQESSGAFKVLINDLKEEDSGLYLCGTQGLKGQDSPQEVLLQVATASTLPRRPKFLRGTVGGSLSFQCHHDPQGTYERKYLCRWRAGSCQVLLDDEGFVLESHRGRAHMASSPPELGSSTVLLGQLREEDAGWYWCGARSGDTELTSSLKLLIHKGNCSSRGPGTATPEGATAPRPAALSTAGHSRRAHGMGTVTPGTRTGTVTYGTSTGTVPKDTRMGTVPKDTMGTVPKDTMGTVTPGTRTGTVTYGTSTGTVPKDTMGTVTPGTRTGTVTYGTSTGTVPKDTMGTVTPGTRTGTVTYGTSTGTVPKDTRMGTVPKDTMGTVTPGTSSLLPTATPGTSAASPGDAFQESSSGEPQLLPVVLSALLFLICITIIILTLAKIKLQKQTGGGSSSTGGLEPALARAGLSPGKEERMEENPSPGEEQEFRMGSGKCRTISAILGNIRMTSFYLPYGEKLLEIFSVESQALNTSPCTPQNPNPLC
ncbi:polymeric immunoglobulin receptor-like isoform X2 [Motacilla alba alba]|uniref:polymeric immunoglobulin receptor-like isoform X2 n=1 Tax=Motacilla alba alba TaxID=1094192 RepID=UPI0018D51F98|nr:polymeric immunoglobulin receptor-like isoform X2 [Motacilla alba alba]